jgi:hypothetical protein
MFVDAYGMAGTMSNDVRVIPLRLVVTENEGAHGRRRRRFRFRNPCSFRRLYRLSVLRSLRRQRMTAVGGQHGPLTSPRVEYEVIQWREQQANEVRRFHSLSLPRPTGLGSAGDLLTSLGDDEYATGAVIGAMKSRSELSCEGPSNEVLRETLPTNLDTTQSGVV